MCCASVIMTALRLASWIAVTVALKDVKVLGIVYPTYLTARGLYGEKVLRINDHITLTLKQSEVLSNFFVLLSDGNNGRRFHEVNPEAFNGHLYYDEEALASLFVHSEDPVEVEGMLNATLRIKPADEMARSKNSGIPHTIYQVTYNDYDGETRRSVKDILKQRHLGKQKSSTTTYPEIYIVVDFAFAKHFQFNDEKIIRYLCISVNAVNLRFATITSPRIQVRIVGITIPHTREKYLHPVEGHSNVILAVDALAKFHDFYLSRLEFQNSDLVLFITGLDLAYYADSELDLSPEGYAYIGAICLENKVAIVEDQDHEFRSTHVIAHELGHSLGCVHDGDGPLGNITGQKGSKECSKDDGYIMSYTQKNKNQFTFSHCCQKDMSNLISQDKWQCLKRSLPRQRISFPGLPGNYVSGRKHCEHIFPGKNCFFDEEYGVKDCKIHCRCKRHYYKVPALDGAPCNTNDKNGKHCELGECVDRTRRATKQIL